MFNDDKRLNELPRSRYQNVRSAIQKIAHWVQRVLHWAAVGCFIAFVVFIVGEVLYGYVPFESYVSCFFGWAFIFEIARELVVYLFIRPVSNSETLSQ